MCENITNGLSDHQGDNNYLITSYSELYNINLKYVSLLFSVESWSFFVFLNLLTIRWTFWALVIF